MQSKPGAWRTDPRCRRPPAALACVHKRYAWVVPGQPFLAGEAACSRLADCGLTEFLFVGDSLLWHAFVALVFTLSGNFHAIPGFVNYRKNATCSTDQLFWSKVCRGQPAVRLCAGNVTLRHVTAPWPVPQPPRPRRSLAVVWGAGWHPLPGAEGRYGVNNATAVRQHVYEAHCSNGTFNAFSNLSASHRPTLLWARPHARPGMTHPDETPPMVAAYGLQTSADVQRLCGASTIDFWTFTNKLVCQFPSEVRRLTQDTCHWGRAVNLVKAQLLLREIFRVRDCDRPRAPP
eukprot:EG_transcript_14352